MKPEKCHTNPLTRHRSIVRRACERGETPAALTFRSRPPGPRLAVTRGSRSAKPEARGQRISRHVTTADPIYNGRPYIEVTAPAPLAVVGWRQASGHLQVAELVSLIVVPNMSGTTRRFSLAMGTLGTRGAGPGRSRHGGVPGTF